MRRDTLISVISLVVSFAWLCVALVSLLIRDYTALTIVTPVMLVVTGVLYGKAPVKNGNGNGH